MGRTGGTQFGGSNPPHTTTFPAVGRHGQDIKGTALRLMFTCCVPPWAGLQGHWCRAAHRLQGQHQGIQGLPTAPAPSAWPPGPA
eukprot:1157349-Pelagomonas_calceolata.AAC.17